VLPLLVLLPGTVVFCVSMVGESFLTAVGRPGRVTLAELTGLGVTLVGLPLIVPHFGIVGAAALSSASYVVVLVLCLTFLRQTAPVSVRVRREDVAELAAMARGVLHGAGAAARRLRA
jgi:O-antigen/teichoic acid export membrane protein